MAQAKQQSQADAARQAQALQEANAALVVPLIAAAFPLLVWSDLPGSVPRFREAFAAIVRRYGAASAAMALQRYRAARFAADASGSVPDVPLVSVLDSFIDQAVAESLAPGPVDAPLQRSLLDSSAQQLVLEQGRRQMMSAAALDKEARGWARIPNPGACSFCLMLAARSVSGLLYTSQESASFKAHRKYPNGSGGDCRCTVEPVFGVYEAPANARDAAKAWDEATKLPDGSRLTGADARRAFRQKVEGRDVTVGRDEKSPRKVKGMNGPKDPKTFYSNQLRLYEALSPSNPEQAAWRSKEIARLKKLLAGLGE